MKSWLRYKYFSDDPESGNTGTHSQYSPRPGTKGKLTGQTCPNYAQTEAGCELRTNKHLTDTQFVHWDLCQNWRETDLICSLDLICRGVDWGGGVAVRSGGLGQVNCCISLLSRPDWLGVLDYNILPVSISPAPPPCLSWHTNWESCELCWFITCFSEIIMSTISLYPATTATIHFIYNR